LVIDVTIAIIIFAIANFCLRCSGAIAPLSADAGFCTFTTCGLARSGQRIILFSAFGIIDVAVAIIILAIADFLYGSDTWFTGIPRATDAQLCAITASNRTGSAEGFGCTRLIIYMTVAIVIFAIADLCLGGRCAIAPRAIEAGFCTLTTCGFAWSSQRIVLLSACGVVDVAIAIIIFTIADLFCGRREWLTCSPRGI
jgi:fumarate reductase subunit C